MGAFCHEHFPPTHDEYSGLEHQYGNPTNPGTEGQGPEAIASDRFGIMDERTLRDDTIVLVRWESWDELIDSEVDEVWRDVKDWANVRVSFRNAAEAVMGIGEDLLVHDFAVNLKAGDDGVSM